MTVVGIIVLVILAATWLLLGFMVGESLPWRGKLAEHLATGLIFGTAPIFVFLLLVEGFSAYHGPALTAVSWYTFTGALGWRHRIWMERAKRRRRWIRQKPLHQAARIQRKSGQV